MAGTTLTKVLLIILSINVLLYIGGVRVVSSDSSGVFMTNFINTDTNQSLSGNITELNGTLTDFSQSSIFGGGLSFIDVLRLLMGFLTFVVNIIFTPFGLFLSAGLPPIVGLIVGLPITILAIIGVAYFIRSGN